MADDNNLRPGFSTIQAALHHQIDIAIIERTILTSFGKSENQIVINQAAISKLSPGGDHDQPWNTVNGVATLPTQELVLGFTSNMFVIEISLEQVPSLEGSQEKQGSTTH